MPRILVIDDTTSLRQLLYDTFSRKGYEVSAAMSGAQAMEILKDQRPDVILLDSGMPGLSGVETAGQIRAFDDAVPIILLQGAGEPEVSAADLLRVGITEVVRKDLGTELFLSAVELSLGRLAVTARHAAEGGVPVRGTLLVVDDDPKIQELLKVFFESAGLRVIVASSGEEALTRLDQKPLLVLLDVMMPGMDGLMTLQKIKARAPKLPIIMVTGVGEQAVVREALAQGAYDYVTKPFNLEYLQTMVLTKVLLGMGR